MPSSREQIAPLRAALDEDPTDASALRSLFDLYQRADMKDRACCVAEALIVLHKASPGQTLWRGQYRPRVLPAAREPLTPKLVRDHVAHPDQDRYVTAILNTIAPALAAWRAVELPPTLDPADRVDVAVEISDAARMIKYAWRVLGVDRPDVFFRRESQGDYTLLNAKHDGFLRPSLVLFDGLLDRRKEPELGYAIGRAMADMYWPHFAFVAIDRDPRALEVVLRACLHRCGYAVPGDHAAHDVIASEIFGRLSPSAQQELVRIIGLAVEAEADLDADRWADAAELTACRVGLLLSGDLCSAVRALREEASPLCAPTRASARARRIELVRYGVSEDYFLVREALGIDATV